MFQIVKEHYLKPDSQVSFEIVGDNVFHSLSQWRPQGDSNPCYSRERAVS
nr:hypothetical protein SYMBAF_290002 [Serratia symbiotica]